jgi:hypothetical protein
MYDCYVIGRDNKQENASLYHFYNQWRRGIGKIVVKKDGVFNTASNSYFPRDTIILVPKKIEYRKSVPILDLNSYKYNSLTGFTLNNNIYEERLGRKNKICPFELGNSLKIYKYVTEIRKYIETIAFKYEDVPLDYIEEYKEKKRKEYQDNKQFEKERVVYKDEYNSYVDIQLKKLLEYRRIFYCLKDENFDIQLFWEIIKRSNFKNMDFIFIKISNTQYQKIKKYKLIHMSKFLENDKLNNTLYKIKLANYIRYKISSQKFPEPPYKVSIYYYEIYKTLDKFCDKYTLNLKNIKVNTHKRKHNCCWKITKLFKEYLDIIDKFEIFNYTHSVNIIPNKHLRTIVRGLKITKINPELYTNKN